MEGIEHLVRLWGINDPNVKDEVATCLENTKKGKGVIGEKKDHFDITCNEGSVRAIGIIKKKGKVTVQELSQALKKLPDVENLFLDASNISGQIADLDLSQHHRLKRIQMRWCLIEGELKDLRLSVKLSGTGLEALKLSGKGVRGSLSDLKNWTRLLFLDLQKTSVTGNLSTDFPKPDTLEGLWLQDTDVTGDITCVLKRTASQGKAVFPQSMFHFPTGCNQDLFMFLQSFKVWREAKDPVSVSNHPTSQRN